MPSFPIIDSHLHLWDPRRLSYPWLFPPLDRPFLPADFQAASAGVAVEALVFLECAAEIHLAFDEAQQVLAWAKEEPRIAAMVCNAALEQGDAVRADLERLAGTDKVRGIRRIYQDEPDPAFCLRPDFVFPESGFMMEEAIDELVLRAVKQANGNVSAAARLLGVSRDVVRYRIRGTRDAEGVGE